MENEKEGINLKKELTPEMMRKLTRKVYALWQRDLDLDRQKRGRRLKPVRGRQSYR